MIGERIDNLVVQKLEQIRARVDQVDFDSQVSKDRSVFNTTQISTEPRKPEEYASKQISGRSFCAVCQGGGNKRETLEAVRQCPSVECWLWPFRNGGVPDQSDVAGMKEEK